MSNHLQGPLSLPYLEIGKHTYWWPSVLFKTYFPEEKITIGKYCSIGDQVVIMTGGMRHTDTAALFPLHLPSAYVTTKNIEIGHDVWIGFRSNIFNGAKIGTGAIIGAGANIASDVPPFAVVIGNPAKILRYRFSDAIIDALQQIAWWDWPEHKLLAEREWFYKPIEAFVEKFK